MLYDFEAFTKEFGTELPIKYFSLEPNYSVNFIDNPKTFFLYKDIDQLSAQFEDINLGFKQKMENYLGISG